MGRGKLAGGKVMWTDTDDGSHRAPTTDPLALALQRVVCLLPTTMHTSVFVQKPMLFFSI
eukprot:scaffold1495_cov186-Alexandrium_tamarense.AAC.36